MAWWWKIAALYISTANAQSSYLPVQGSSIASDVDNLFNFILWVSVFFFILLMAGMVFFVTRYRRKTESDKTAYITHSTVLEFLWSFIPLVLLLAIFFWGWSVYKNARTFPANAEQIQLTGKQWQWVVKYSNGKEVVNDMYVPVGKPVTLTMSSQDVIHSFYVPAFRVKQDIVPGKITKLWFEAKEPGEYRLFCTEFCGTAHSGMIGKVVAVAQADYDAWLQKQDSAGGSPVEVGQTLFTTKGCVACHSVDGSPKVGPSFKGIWGTEQKLADGTTAMMDENYTRESILNPNAKIVAGFAPAMPSFQGQLKEEEILALIEYLKSLK